MAKVPQGWTQGPATPKGWAREAPTTNITKGLLMGQPAPVRDAAEDTQLRFNLDQPSRITSAERARADAAGKIGVSKYQPFGQAFLAGLSDLGALASSAYEATGEVTGWDELAAAGRRGRVDYSEDAEEYGARGKFAEINSVGDALSWALQTTGNMIPVMVPAVAGGALGAGAGTVGAIAGAFVPSLGLGVGEVQMGMKDKDPNAKADGWVFAGGTAIAALDSILPGKIGGQFVKALGRETAEEVALRALLRPASKTGLARIAKGAGKDAMIEGVTESVQEAIGEIAASKAAEQGIDWASLPANMLEAGAAGALMGGLAGGGTGAVEARSESQRNRAALEADERATGAAAAAAFDPILTDSDRASALPDDMILAGKKKIADLLGENPFRAPESPRVAALPEVEQAAPAAPKPPRFNPDALDARKQFMDRVRGVESGGNDQAKNTESSASGRYQFTRGTWEGLGGDWSKRFDAGEQERLMKKLTDQNQAALQRGGVPETAGNFYLAHFAGSAGAVALHKNPNGTAEQILGADVVKANPFLAGMKGRDVIAWAAKKMGSPAPSSSTVDPSPIVTEPAVEETPAKPRESATEMLERVLGEDVLAPTKGQKVEVTRDGETVAGTVAETWDDRGQAGVKIELADGRVINEALDDVRDAGVRITAPIEVARVEDSSSTLPAQQKDSSNIAPRERALELAARKVREGTATAGFDREGSFSFGQKVNPMQPGTQMTPGKVHVELEDARGKVHTFTEAEVRAAAAKGGETPPPAPAPTSGPTFTDTPSGKGIEIAGLTEAQKEAISAAVPNITASAGKNGALLFSKKHEAKIRAALETSPALPANPASGSRAFFSDGPDENGIDKSDVVAVVDANNLTRNARAPAAEREAFRLGAAFQMGLAKPKQVEATARDQGESFRAGMAKAKAEYTKRRMRTPKREDDGVRDPAKPEGLPSPWQMTESGEPINTADPDVRDFQNSRPKSKQDALKERLATDRAAKGGARTMRDWKGVEVPDYSEQGQRGDYDGGPTKDAFLKDAKEYLTAVADVLAKEGFEGRPGKPKMRGKDAGKPARPLPPVSVSEGGTAVAGDVYLEMYPRVGGGPGVMLQVGMSAMNGPAGGASVIARRMTVQGERRVMGDNNWWPANLPAQEMADRALKLIGFDRDAAPAAETPRGQRGATSEIEAGFAANREVVGNFKKGDAVEFDHSSFYRDGTARTFLGTVVGVSSKDQGIIEVLGERGGTSFVPARKLRAQTPDGAAKARADEIRSGAPEAAPTNQEVLAAAQESGRVEIVDTRTPAAPSKFAGNKLFTEDKVEAARARLREKMNRLNAGVDPEALVDGMTIAGAYIEAGIRNFAEFAKAMTEDFGDNIRPFLLSFWEGARNYPGLDNSGMTPPDAARAMHDMLLAGMVSETSSLSVNNNGIAPTQETTDVDVSTGLLGGDAGAGPGDVQRASQNRGDDLAPRSQGGRSEEALRGPDQRQEDAGEQRSGGQPAGSERGARTGLLDADNLPAVQRDTGRPADAVTGSDWVIEPGSLAEGRSFAQKARDNVDAIALVKQIEREGRMATRTEQATIARYVGWGGLKNAFPDTQGNYGKGFEEIGPRLRELLTDEEYTTAQRSIQYAHYTGETVVRAMWSMAERLGFRGGSVFEPGMGVGNFKGMMPPTVAQASGYQGLEYDHLTASIARLLYPQSGVRQADYTRTPAMFDAVDLVIGNPPFSETTVSSDPEFGKLKFLLHDFFFAKSLAAVKPGGLLMFVTSAGTMNKQDTRARQWMAERADLVGAVRLPGNAFEKNAGTSVTTDIVILRKRREGEAAGDSSWVETTRVDLPDRNGDRTPGNVSNYFLANPDMILGEQGMFDTLTAGLRYAVRAPAGFDLDAALANAASSLPANVVDTTPAALPPGVVERGGEMLDLGSGERKDGSFYLGPKGELMRYQSGVGREVQSSGKGVTGGISKANQEKIRALIPIKTALRDVYAADLKEDDAAGKKARKALNTAYDAFVDKFGPINKVDISFRRPSRVELEGMRAEAREEARLAGAEWDEGSFDLAPFLESGAGLAEIAREREAAREAATEWDEGSFDPAEVPDKVVEKYPNLEAFLASDEEGYRVAAIENFGKETGQAGKGRIFSENVVRLEAVPTINGAQDALYFSLNRLGRPDIAFIAREAGLSQNEVLEQLGDQLFEVPGQPGTYETAEMYLSGNVREKLATAREQADRNPALERNVAALEAAMPLPLTPSEIAANLGMPWMPTATVEQFAREALGLTIGKVTYLPKMAVWTVTGNRREAAATATWGTQRMDALALLESALNKQTAVVKDTFRTADGSTRTVINEVDTQAAQDKQTAIKQAFRDWVWSDEARTLALVTLYNEQYNSLVAPNFNGSYLTTPGINTAWQWRPHQSSVVARIVQSGNTYMAHEVGAGKTSAMIGAGMEMKRLGLVNKPMYVVPNHMLGQFTKEFYEQYPLARIRVADESRFHTSRRKQFVAQVANDDLDAIIITHSGFGYVPLSDDFLDSMLAQQIEDLSDMLAEIGKDPDQRITRRNVEVQKEKLEQRLSGKRKKGTDKVFTFEEMGVDFLFVDEAHLFRKLDFATKMGNVKGVDPNGSQASFDLFAKTRYLETIRPGRNLVLASGTPITNTMAELYSLSRYLQQAELEKRGLGHFDAWAGAFGDTMTTLEQTPAGTYEAVTRFAQFVNVPELSVMVRQVMDVVDASKLRQYVSLPTLKGGARQMVMADQTPSQQDYQAELKRRMDAIKARTGKPQKGDDIILSVIGDGRKSAIDYRLIDASAPREEGSKLELLIESVAERYAEFKRVPFHSPLPGGKGYSEKPVTHGPATQMVFSDFGINGAFPVQKYIKQSLVARGVPAKEIAIISDFKTHVAKQRLFNDMNEGKVRVLIGSTAKMGTGVNAQKRLRAIHNMDAQWFPANDTQRNGRGIRQGNMNPEVEIVDYATQGTYDSTMWGLMAKKGKFIEGFMRGDPTMRDMEDLGEASQYEQAAAMTTADPRIMGLTADKQELEKLQRQRIAFERGQQEIQANIRDAEQRVADATRLIPLIEQDIAQRAVPEKDAFTGTVDGAVYDEPAEFGEAILTRLDAVIEEANGGKLRRGIGEFGGFLLVAEVFPYQGEPAVEIAIKRAGDRESVIEPGKDSRGVVTRLTNALGKFDTQLEKARRDAENYTARAADFRTRTGETYDDGGRAAELKQKIEALEATLKAESEAAEKARAPANGVREAGSVDSIAPLFTPGITDVDVEAVQVELRARLDSMGLQAVRLDLTTRRQIGRPGATNPPEGRYIPGRRIIQVALDAGQGREFVLDHEAIHALRDAGAFSQLDWQILTRGARNSANWDSIASRYPNLSPEARLEEGVADLFADFQQTMSNPVNSTILKVIARVLKVLDAVRSVVSGKGFATERRAFDVLSDVASGAIGAQQGQFETGNAANKNSLALEEVVTLGGTDPTWRGKMAEGFDAWRRTLQDRYLPLLKVQREIEQQTGQALPNRLNPYQGEELMTGRIAAQLEKLTEEMAGPLFDAMAEEKVTVEELETYLYARHAPERNAQIFKINSAFEEGAGSGMSDIQAEAIMRRIEGEGRTRVFERLAQRVDAIRDYATDYRVESGLMSQEQADAWRETYQYYVPLRGFKEVEGDAASVERINRSGGGINVRGPESKAAYGRRSTADSPLAYLILQAEEAIVRGETNRVAQRFVELAQANPDPDFWKVNKVESKRVMNPDTGMVEDVLVTALTAADKDFTVVAKFGGKERRVTMNRQNPAAFRLADAMRRLTEHQMDWWVLHLGKVNRFLSAVNTSYNPEFVITNAFRDIQTATVNTMGLDVEGLTKNTLRDYRKALVASTKGAFRKGEGEWRKWYDEFVESGGRTAFNRVENVDEIKKRIEETMAMARAKTGETTARLQVKRSLLAAKDLIESLNNGVENAVRLAAYKNAREAGLDRDKAASLAKNLTVNFNRRGTAGPAMNAAYLFFNASVQGSTRLFQAMRSRKVQKLMAGVVGFGMAVELLNAMVSDDDEDGESFYDKIPAYEKSRNLIFMLPNGQEHIKIPLPYGYNAFFVAGQSAAEIMRRGGERWTESAGNLLTTVVDSFNPVGGSESLLNFLAPTIADPVVDLVRNRDFADRPIMPENPPYGTPEPASQRYWPSVGPHWRAVTDFLSDATGGDKIVGGAVEVSPEVLEHMAGVVIGAAGATVDRMAGLVGKAADPSQVVEVNDVIFARKLVGQKAGWYDKTVYYDRQATLALHLDNTKDYLKAENVEGARAYAQQHAAILGLRSISKQASKEMTGLRRSKRAVEHAYELGKINDAQRRAALDEAKASEDNVIRAFNSAWNQAINP